MSLGSPLAQEIANLRWSWINEEERTIALADWVTKNRRGHTYPYWDLTASVLASVPRENDDRLFKGRGDNIWNGWSKTKRDFDPLAQQWQLHDLRRVYRTIHGSIGTPPYIGERLVNHVSKAQSDV